ncbi:Dipeptidyl peptidase 4 [Merluccius polli]|uniref:Dipeptidyl peptidase 4 n=1 Tax=Merluccius polli TaxID=89951 RepID=A0AA47N4I6_MERPO|nr:Dipeptidyl peptidase 4 [Merluccius polli]
MPPDVQTGLDDVVGFASMPAKTRREGKCSKDALAKLQVKLLQTTSTTMAPVVHTAPQATQPQAPPQIAPAPSNTSNNGGSENGRTYSLKDAFNSTLSPSSYAMRWISDVEYLHKTNGSVFRHNAETGHLEEFLNDTLFVSFDAASLQHTPICRVSATNRRP